MSFTSIPTVIFWLSFGAARSDLENGYSCPPYRHVGISSLELFISLRGKLLDAKSTSDVVADVAVQEHSGTISSLDPSGSLVGAGTGCISAETFSNYELGISKISTLQMRSPCSSPGTKLPTPTRFVPMAIGKSS